MVHALLYFLVYQLLGGGGGGVNCQLLLLLFLCMFLLRGGGVGPSISIPESLLLALKNLLIILHKRRPHRHHAFKKSGYTGLYMHAEVFGLFIKNFIVKLTHACRGPS